MPDTVESLKAPMPENISIEKRGFGLMLTYRWFSTKFLFLAPFCLFWDGFLVFWYYKVFTEGAPLVAILFPLIHLCVGIGLTYSTIAGFVNRTVLNVSKEFISIVHRPLPWLGNKTIPGYSITQLYVEEVVRTTRRGASVSYRLNAITNENKKVKLASNLDSHDTAIFLEQEIESYLGLQDRKVPGEAST